MNRLIPQIGDTVRVWEEEDDGYRWSWLGTIHDIDDHWSYSSAWINNPFGHYQDVVDFDALTYTSDENIWEVH